MTLPLLIPDWPAPPRVRACVSTRVGGVSRGPYDSLNLGDHVGDDPAAVAENRRRLTVAAGLDIGPQWLQQVHGRDVVQAGRSAQADACWTRTPGTTCAVLTADCLPLLFTSRSGDCVAAAHAGWRGLAAGIIEATIESLRVAPRDLLVWLGPAIGAGAFQVGNEVRAAFVSEATENAAAFVADGSRWRADLFALARLRLARCGVTSIHGGDYCTFGDAERFFSHRREAPSGRFASLVWIASAG